MAAVLSFTFHSPSMGLVTIESTEGGYVLETPDALERHFATAANAGRAGKIKFLSVDPDAFRLLSSCFLSMPVQTGVKPAPLPESDQSSFKSVFASATAKSLPPESDFWRRARELAEKDLAERFSCITDDQLRAECSRRGIGHVSEPMVTVERMKAAVAQMQRECGADLQREKKDHDAHEANLARERDEWKRRAETEREKWQGALLGQQRWAEDEYQKRIRLESMNAALMERAMNEEMRRPPPPLVIAHRGEPGGNPGIRSADLANPRHVAQVDLATMADLLAGDE